MQELESSLANKECYIKELETRLEEQKEARSRQHEEIKLLNEKLNTEAKSIKSLERESDRLRAENSLLESRVSVYDVDIVIALGASTMKINLEAWMKPRCLNENVKLYINSFFVHVMQHVWTFLKVFTQLHTSIMQWLCF